MDLLQIIYSSQPFGYDEATLAGVLLDARRCNLRDGVTGALVCRRDVYLQLLEGPTSAVAATLQRIRHDDRHLDLKLHQSEAVAGRLFGDWAMLHDPAEAMMWTEAEIADGALDRASIDEIRAVFLRLAAKAGAAE